MRILLARGADAGIRLDRSTESGMGRGDTLLHVASRFGSMAALVTLLREHQYLLTVRNAADETSLMLASGSGHHEAVRALLRTGRAQPNVRGGTERATGLWFAAAQGHRDVVDVFEELVPEVELDASAADGSTPLIMAVKGGYENLFLDLHEWGADVNIRDRWNRSARSYAKGTAMEDVLLAMERLPRYLRWSVVVTTFLMVSSILRILCIRIFDPSERVAWFLALSVSALLSFIFAALIWKQESRISWLVNEIDGLGTKIIVWVLAGLGHLIAIWILFRLLRALSVALISTVRGTRSL